MRAPSRTALRRRPTRWPDRCTRTTCWWNASTTTARWRKKFTEDGPLAEQARDDGPLVEEVHEPAGLGFAGDHERFVARWQEIQAGFVDEPRRAVQDADALVVDMMDRLARMLASERDQLESAGETGKVSTEDLRQGLRRYRTLFERLLAV